jgi:RNA polymerase sigma factor (sigma-70 family)
MERPTAVMALEAPEDSGADLVPTFEEFFGAQHVTLYRALWLATGNTHEAEEIMQDAFLKLWERWERIAALDDPVGYLYRTAMNVLRSRRRRAAVALRKAIGHIPADDGLAAVEGRDAVVRVVSSLTPRQRAVVVLTGVLGLTSAEAGELLGISPSTVRVLGARARTALKEQLGGGDDRAG